MEETRKTNRTKQKNDTISQRGDISNRSIFEKTIEKTLEANEGELNTQTKEIISPDHSIREVKYKDQKKLRLK